MNRITECFNNLRENGNKALIPFITAGDPAPDITLPLLHALVKGGANIIEVGVPFSDPMADGPVIQRSSERALKFSVSLSNVLDMVARFRTVDQQTPIILMGYLNPVEIMGYEAFAKRASAAGVDGVLLVDMPPEESDELQIYLKRHNIDQIFLLAPTTSDARLELICSKGSGFLYYVSLKGVTGSNRLNIQDVANRIAHIRSKTDMPVGVGFGIKDPATAKSVAGFSDAIIIGSALVERIAQSQSAGQLADDIAGYIGEIRTAIDAI
jgi:tryptophan synthase alpha chain